MNTLKIAKKIGQIRNRLEFSHPATTLPRNNLRHSFVPPLSTTTFEPSSKTLQLTRTVREWDIESNYFKKYPRILKSDDRKVREFPSSFRFLSLPSSRRGGRDTIIQRKWGWPGSEKQMNPDVERAATWKTRACQRFSISLPATSPRLFRASSIKLRFDEE